MKVLLTGATGFLGSHIAELLVERGLEVIAIKRRSSNMWRCAKFQDKITWFEFDSQEATINEIASLHPEIILHAAWSGVKSNDRNDIGLQNLNMDFLEYIFRIARSASLSRIIALGSQAEYGDYEGVVSEIKPCRPTSSYGKAKVKAAELLEAFAEKNNMEWYWLRLFSVYGPREDNNWLIPSTIRKLLKNERMDLTNCDQRYDYLFVKDFARGILSVLNSRHVPSGKYNFSSGASTALKNVLSLLEAKLSPQNKLLYYGVIPYRPAQVMHMEGDSNLFQKSFQFVPETNLIEGLDETIRFYKGSK
jgi:nucleoside-diphosphate-sugar epimerase